MLLDSYVVIKWNSKNKNRYVSLGYEFTKMGDAFHVSTNHVSDSCAEPVSVKCDYCGKIYKKSWHRYVKENKLSEIKNDCCYDCKKYKIIDTANKKYGVNSVLSLDEIKDKIKSTNIERYGSENVFSSEEIKNRLRSTNIKKYGVPIPMMNSSIIDKLKKTCRNRYGYDSYAAYYSITHRKELSPTWKGGVNHSRVERSTFEYIEWRRNVFMRDSYTCLCCGTKSGNGKEVSLNAHHVMNWKDNKDLRYDLNNGVTLCKECHNEFHSIYGKRNNTREQLNEFILNHGKKVC